MGKSTNTIILMTRQSDNISNALNSLAKAIDGKSFVEAGILLGQIMSNVDMLCGISCSMRDILYEIQRDKEMES